MLNQVKPTNKYLIYFLAFIIIQGFLFVFFPANRIEVDDAFWYADSIRDLGYSDLFNPRFFLFLPLFKSVYDCILLLGVEMQAYHFLCVASIIFSGLTLILLYDTLRKYLRFDSFSAFFVVVLLAISYEYWRYAMEAEIYIVTLFFVLLTLRLFLRWENSRSSMSFFAVCLLAAFTTLLYKPAFIPLYLIFPLLFLYYKKYSLFVIYNTIGAVVIVGAFLIVYLLTTPETSFMGYLFGGANEPAGSPAGAIFVIGSNMLSVLWVFSIDDVVSFISDRFPHKVIEEEVFLARQVDGMKYLLLMVLLAIAVIFIYLLINAFRYRKIYKKERFKNLTLIILWMVLYSGFLLFMDPTSNEPWLMIQIPLVIIFGAFFIEPLKGSRRWVAIVFLLLIFINNMVGGMSLLRDQRFDYYHQKSQWLRSNASASDYIITYGPMAFIRYLRYYTPSKVINLEEDQDKAFRLLHNADEVLGHVYFPEDIFKPPKAIMYRTKIDMERLTALYEQYDYKMQEVSGEKEPWFNTYKLVMK